MVAKVGEDGDDADGVDVDDEESKEVGIVCGQPLLSADIVLIALGPRAKTMRAPLRASPVLAY